MHRSRIVGVVFAGIAILAVGVWLGTLLPISSSVGKSRSAGHGHQHATSTGGGHSHSSHSHSSHSNSSHSNSSHSNSGGDDDILVLDGSTIKTLGLKQARVRLQDVWRNLRIPATIVEKPGSSEHGLASPVNGIVQKLFIVPGQAVSPGDELFRLRVTDEALSQAQVDLLNAITRMDVIDAELARLEPLIQSGTVSGQRKRELTYERQQLDAQRQLHAQELLMRGLNEEQVEAIVKTRELVRDFVVRLPGHASHDEKKIGDEEESNYSIESVIARPGTTVKRGDDLCRMAYHSELYLTGSAFENELDAIVKVADDQQPLSAVFGTRDAEYRREGLGIEYIDNHVDEASQTFSFYIPLKNEVMRDVTNEDGVRFRTWRFKPGQRAHLAVPIEKYADHIRLPVNSIVRDGIHVYVFFYLHAHGDEHEYRRVPVEVAFQDEQYAVLKNNGSLKVGRKVAANRAFELNLELKAEAGGGGHGHGHAH